MVVTLRFNVLLSLSIKNDHILVHVTLLSTFVFLAEATEGYKVFAKRATTVAKAAADLSGAFIFFQGGPGHNIVHGL